MARLITEGFEDGTAMSFLWPGAILTSPTRTGAYSTSGGTLYVGALSEVYIRFGFNNYLEQNRTAVIWYSGVTPLGSLICNQTSGQLIVYVGSTPVITCPVGSYAPGNRWSLIELHIVIGDSGAIELRVDGVPFGSFSGDTKPGADATLDRFIFGDDSKNAFDDIAVNDTTGAADNSWCGDGHIIALMPNANGDVSQLVGSDGNSTDNYALVDELPPNTTDYAESDTVDEYDLYHLAACGLTDVTIKRVWPQAHALNTVAVGDKVALGIKPSGGAEAWGSDQTLTTAYQQFKGTVHTVNPATSAAWSVADLDALQVGVKAR